MSTVYDYNHDDQIEKFTLQVTRAMSGFQVRADNQGGLQRVSVAFGAPERIVAAINSNDDKFTNYTVPMMGLMLTSMDINPDRMTTSHFSEALTFRDDLGDHKQLNRTVGVPIELSYEVAVYASSISQLLELVEQISLTLYDGITVQKSNDITDSNYRAKLRLSGISSGISYPVGTGRNLATVNLNLVLNIMLSYPQSVIDTYIEQVELGTGIDGSGTLRDIEVIT